MKRNKATQIIHNALVGYVEDCAGANSPEAQQIEKAWDTLKEFNVTPEEAEHMRVVLNHLDAYSELYDTQMKVMRALGIKI
jgi:hypothetical protein